MKIREVNENKKQFIALLLLADEQEKMFNHYLEIEYGKKSIGKPRYHFEALSSLLLFINGSIIKPAFSIPITYS